MDIDVATVVAAFAAIVAALGLVGAAKMMPNAAIKAWSWVQAAIRG